MRHVAPPVLHALFEHGIVFEPHLQNVLIGVDGDGLPVQAVLRDLEGVKLVTPRHDQALAALKPEVASALGYDAERGWRRVAYCLFVNHLAEVAAAVADRHPRAEDFEAALWDRARTVLTGYAGEHGWPPRLREVLAGVPLPAKANLRLRWARAADREASYLTVRNPLGDAHGQPVGSPLARPVMLTPAASRPGRTTRRRARRSRGGTRARRAPRPPAPRCRPTSTTWTGWPRTWPRSGRPCRRRSFSTPSRPIPIRRCCGSLPGGPTAWRSPRAASWPTPRRPSPALGWPSAARARPRPRSPPRWPRGHGEVPRREPARAAAARRGRAGGRPDGRRAAPGEPAGRCRCRSGRSRALRSRTPPAPRPRSPALRSPRPPAPRPRQTSVPARAPAWSWAAGRSRSAWTRSCSTAARPGWPAAPPRPGRCGCAACTRTWPAGSTPPALLGSAARFLDFARRLVRPVRRDGPGVQPGRRHGRRLPASRRPGSTGPPTVAAWPGPPARARPCGSSRAGP